MSKNGQEGGEAGEEVSLEPREESISKKEPVVVPTGANYNSRELSDYQIFTCAHKCAHTHS